MPRPRAVLNHAALTSAFAPDGLHGVSTDELARRARVAKPTLYARGRSKDAVFLACVQAEVERLVGRLHTADQRTAGQPLHQRAAALAQALLNHAARQPDAFRLLHVTASHRNSTVAADVDRALHRIPDRIAVALRRDLTATRADDDRVIPAAHALHGAAAALAGTVTDTTATASMLGRAIAAAMRPPSPEPIAPRDAIELGIY
ncbi:MAG TPA: helix-turn-helix domain-containing protein [Solirubrobacteraceae bacterium]|nr:helix-turn-helix domain-containing protein [Solirubrobacteraceae bacterium]